MRHLLLLLSILVGTFSNQALSNEVYEFYGDSLTTGFLADSEISDPLPRNRLKQIKRRLVRSEVLNRLTSGKPRRALEQYDVPSLAWPTFLVRELEEEDEEKVFDIENYAFSGARSEDLSLELSLLDSDNPVEATAFIFIGHNDLSQGKKPGDEMLANFLKNYKKALSVWDKAHKNSQLYLLPVGDLTKVYDSLSEYTWRTNRKKRLTCEDMWNHFMPYRHFFPSSGPDKIDDFIDIVGKKIDAMNEGIGKLASDFKSTNDNSVTYLDGLLDIAMEPDYFASDCFHLSRKGQKELAHLIAKKIKK